MGLYDLQVLRGPDSAVQIEPLEARDEAEARMLAELRLTLTGDFAQVVLARGGRPIACFKRDSLRAGRTA